MTDVLDFNGVAVVVSVASFMAVLGVIWAARVFLNPERTARDRVADFTATTRGEDALVTTTAQVTGMAESISALAKPSDAEEADLQRARLLQAGFRARNGLEIFSAIRALLAIVLPAITFVLLPKMALQYTLFFVLLMATIGYYGPSLYVSNRHTKRQEALLKPFPDALDLLVSSVEAGLGLDSAFRRVAKEMEAAAPDLAGELQMVNLEVNAGVARIQALRNLDARTGLREVNSLVNVLMQAERFGTSVARALRVHSDLVRTKRMLAAEEAAAKVSPKLTVAMILFILPSLFAVIGGPAFINVVRNLMPAMAGN